MAVQVRMSNLAQTETRKEYTDSPAKVGSVTKKRKEYPTVQINSKQMPGLQKLSKDSNVVLVLKAEVKGVREPDQWDQDRYGLTPEDCVVEFKLMEGSVEIMPEMKKPKD